jgi:hypothetical protein
MSKSLIQAMDKHFKITGFECMSLQRAPVGKKADKKHLDNHARTMENSEQHHLPAVRFRHGRNMLREKMVTRIRCCYEQKSLLKAQEGLNGSLYHWKVDCTAGRCKACHKLASRS